MLLGKLNQIATYWAPGKRDPFGGVSWGKPQIIKVRWQEHQKLIRNKAGLEVVSDAVVYTTEDIDLSGRLYLGKSTATNPTDSEQVRGAREPQAKSSMVGLNGEIVGWKVWL